MIIFRSSQLAAIRSAGEQAYPGECCGLLAGMTIQDGDLDITRVVASTNILAADTDDRFEINPQTQFDLMRELRDGPESIVGHYHSHPDHPALPSERDMEFAWEAELIWVIASVQDGITTEIRAHKVNPSEARFIEIEMKIVD